MTITVNSSVTASVDGRAVPSSKLPPFVQTMEVEVEDVSPEGDALLGFELTHAVLGDASELHPEIALRMQSALDAIVGTRGSYRCTTRGFIHDVEIEIPSGVAPPSRQFLESTRESLHQLVAPLPERRVGQGAKWRVDTTIELGGVRLNQSAVFRVARLQPPRMDVRVRVEQSAGKQKIAALGVPEEEQPELKSLQSSGTGSARWNLEKATPAQAKMSVKVDVRMRVRDENGRAHAMMTTTKADMVATSGPSSNAPTSDYFDAETLQAKIKSNLWRIRRCYEEQLRANLELSGKVVVEFAIEESGQVSRAEAVENTTGSDAMATCVTNELLHLRFTPGPKGGSVVFRYPFVFQPTH